MPSYFLDSCALAKAYHVETGTPKMLALLADAASQFFISSLTVIEMQSVFSQKVRDGKIDETDYRLVKKRFAADIDRKRLFVKNLLRPQQQMAEKLLEKHAKVRRLRTLDALQLGAALELWPKLRLDHFVSSDKHLVEVARLEGISVVNPDDP
jgi:predicted nucleic acid-binding protein